MRRSKSPTEPSFLWTQWTKTRPHQCSEAQAMQCIEMLMTESQPSSRGSPSPSSCHTVSCFPGSLTMRRERMLGKKRMKWKGRKTRNEMYNFRSLFIFWWILLVTFCHDTNKHFPKLSSSSSFLFFDFDFLASSITDWCHLELRRWSCRSYFELIL